MNLLSEKHVILDSGSSGYCGTYKTCYSIRSIPRHCKLSQVKSCSTVVSHETIECSWSSLVTHNNLIACEISAFLRIRTRNFLFKRLRFTPSLRFGTSNLEKNFYHEIEIHLSRNVVTYFISQRNGPKCRFVSLI